MMSGDMHAFHVSKPSRGLSLARGPRLSDSLQYHPLESRHTPKTPQAISRTLTEKRVVSAIMSSES
jgi:hypothetical protein